MIISLSIFLWMFYKKSPLQKRSSNQSGIDEDPDTGSAHTTLTPYWANVLNKKELTARQLSKRQSSLKCKLLGDRFEISGQAVLYMIGEIETG